MIFIAETGKTYYIQVADQNGTVGGSLGGNIGGLLQFHAYIRNVEVRIGNSLMGTYLVESGNSTRPSYPGVNNGPVKIVSTTGDSIIATERLAWKVNGTYLSYAEMMGLPASQVTNHYIFPWYNNSTMNTELRVGNIGTANTTITVKIAGAVVETFPLNQNETARKYYPGVNNGPMEVSSSGNVDIIATHRFAWFANGMYTSITEMLGLPFGQLTDTYVFPWYNNGTMDTQLRISNVGDATTTITVKIGGVVMETFDLAKDTGIRPSYPGVNDGPVEVTSSGNVPIIVTERLAWKVNGTYLSYAETMGLPANQVTNHYIFPWYNNGTMNTELRVGNIGTANTTITVKIAGAVVETFPLNQNESARKYYPGVNNGPMEVSSSGNVDIITTHRFAWYANNMYTSITEMLGLPFGQLTDAYVFSWYNNGTMDTQLRFGMP